MSDSSPRFGVVVQATDPPDRFARMAETVEADGLDSLWVADSSLHARCAYSYLTLAATRTTRLLLGTAVTNPVTRHPAINVNSIATLDEISDGRVILGLGRGDRPLLELGMTPSSLAGMEDMVTLAHRLLDGETISFEGDGFSTEDAALVGRGGRDVPVYVAASGPKTLAMAGRTADGVIIQAGADPRCLEFAVERVTEGITEAGRALDEVELAAVLYGVINPDRDRAREQSRYFAAWVPQTVPFYCDLVGVPEADAERVRDAYEGGELMKAHAAAAATTEAMVDAFTLSGTEEECRQTVRRILDETPVRHILYFPMGDDQTASIERFASGVAAPLRG